MDMRGDNEPVMRCSVVVPVYNGADILPRCLDALADQTVPLSDYEIVVVDDGSADGTATQVEKWQASHPLINCGLVRQENTGPAAARNHGADLARGPLLLFTDADCAPEPDWIERMISAFENPEVTGAKGAYLSDQTGLTPRFVQAEYEDRYDRMRGQDQIDFVDTYSAGYRRSVFLENQGFDPIFPTASVEDQEFSFRLAQKGHRLVFVPDAYVRHIHDENVAEYARRKYYIGYWKALVTRRHPERMVQDSHTPQVLKVQIVLVAGLLLLAVLSVAGLWMPSLRFSWGLLATGILLFVATGAPFLVKLARRSWALAFAGIFLLFVRALALGSGYLMGTLHFAGNDEGLQTSRA